MYTLDISTSSTKFEPKKNPSKHKGKNNTKGLQHEKIRLIAKNISDFGKYSDGTYNNYTIIM